MELKVAAMEAEAEEVVVVKEAEEVVEEDKNYSDMDSMCELSTTYYAYAALLEVVLNYYTRMVRSEKIPGCENSYMDLVQSWSGLLPDKYSILV